jgi:hypothetical protein
MPNKGIASHPRLHVLVCLTSCSLQPLAVQRSGVGTGKYLNPVLLLPSDSLKNLETQRKKTVTTKLNNQPQLNAIARMSDNITQPNASAAVDGAAANATTDQQTATAFFPPLAWMDDDDRLFSGFEEFSSYGPGGYHPVALGDVFGGRFRVAHKLGFGNDSTV